MCLFVLFLHLLSTIVAVSATIFGSCIITLISLLWIYIKLHLRYLGQPLRMTAQASDWGVHWIDAVGGANINWISLLLIYKKKQPKSPRPTPADGHPRARLGCSLNRRRRVGQRNTMVMIFVGELCWFLTDFLYYSYCRKSTGWDFFVPARTLT
jgi:hypothetical protein